ncbi:MAG: TolB family protein [Gaiellaceae bacterium]
MTDAMALRVIGVIVLFFLPAASPAVSVSVGTALPQTIAFTSDRGCGEMQGTVLPSKGDIYLMNSDGSDVRRVTDTCLESEPVWSPDGAQIAFISQRDGHPELYAINADGSSAHRVTPVGIWVERPAWSTTGLIAFDDLSGIETIKPDGSGLTRVTTEGHDPSWSSDGSRIAFAYDDASTNYFDELGVVAAGGSHLQRIGPGTAPSFSPDGKHLAWASRDVEGAATLVVANADGSDPKAIVTIPTGAIASYDLAPAWSPDSSTLTYDAGPNAEIYRVPATGGTPVRLTVSAASETTSAWRPTIPSTGLAIARVTFAQRACATRPGRTTTTVVDRQGRPVADAWVSIAGCASRRTVPAPRQSSCAHRRISAAASS